jgi:hypothetical protein
MGLGAQLVPPEEGEYGSFEEDGVEHSTDDDDGEEDEEEEEEEEDEEDDAPAKRKRQGSELGTKAETARQQKRQRLLDAASTDALEEMALKLLHSA